MKTCIYCGSKYNDDLLECPGCGGRNYSNVCSNCGTIFEGSLCPKCGVQAGDRGQKCPECGALMFNGVCAACAKKQAAEAEREAAREKAAKHAAETADLSVLSKTLLVALTLVFPFLTNWYVLFSKRTRNGLKAFNILYSAFYVYALLTESKTASSTDTSGIALATIPPILCYGVYTLWKYFRGKKEN